MKRTLLFLALAGLAGSAAAAAPHALLDGRDWAAIHQSPVHWARSMRGNRSFDCHLERYGGGSTLDCVAKRPVDAMGLRVSEFYLLHGNDGEHRLTLVSMAGLGAARNAAAARYPDVQLRRVGPTRWQAGLGGSRSVRVGRREDGAGEVSLIEWSPLPAAARAAGATRHAGVLEGTLAATAATPQRICAVSVGAEAHRCTRIAAGADHYRIGGLPPGGYFVIGYGASRWHPAHARQWSDCTPRPGSDCTDGILQRVEVHAGQVTRAALDHAFTRLPAALRRAPAVAQTGVPAGFSAPAAG